MAWNGSNHAPPSPGKCPAVGASVRPRSKKSTAFKRGVLAVIVVLTLSCAAIWYLLEPRKPSELHPSVKHACSMQVPEDKLICGQKSSHGHSVTSNHSVVSPTVPSLELIKDPPIDAGSLPIPPSSFQSNVYATASDQILSMAVNTSGEIPPIPYTANMDADFKESLKLPVKIYKDDPESVKCAKAAVIAARDTMLEMLKAGKSAKEVLEAHREQVNFQNEMRTKVMCEAKKIFDSGDAAGARSYATLMNVALEQLGIEKIDIPSGHTEQREQVFERKRKEKQENTTK